MSNAMEYPLLSTVFARTPESVWSFLTLKDVLNLSLCSQMTASFGIDADTIQKYLADAKEKSSFPLTKLGPFNLRFSEELTLGMLRRVMNRLHTGTEALVTIDSKTGRVVLDIGSAFNDRDAFLADAVPAEDEDGGMAEQQEIFKHLEICSMDEYDDFNPRHPKPKDKAHRRGDSYFNSDIEMVVNELQGESMAAKTTHTMDIKNIAAMALASEETGDGSHAVKNKFLAMKKKTGAMGSPSKVPKKATPQMAREELRGGSDDER